MEKIKRIIDKVRMKVKDNIDDNNEDVDYNHYIMIITKNEE